MFLLLSFFRDSDIYELAVGSVIGAVVFATVVIALAVKPVIRALRLPPASGAEGMVGEAVRVVSNGGRLYAMAHGEYWHVIPASGSELAPGDEGRIETADARGLVLTVSRTERGK